MKKTIDPGMHTAEHILNSTMERMFGCGRCFSAHIERKKSKCDYHFDRALSPEELNEITAQVNAVIDANLPVTDSFISKGEAQERFNLGRLPRDSGDEIRIVRVGDYDACPCIGPHVAQTSEIGAFRITTSDFKDGVLRIRFKLNRSLNM